MAGVEHPVEGGSGDDGVSDDAAPPGHGEVRRPQYRSIVTDN